MRRHHDSSPISIDRLLNSLLYSLPAKYSKVWSRIPAEVESRTRMIFPWMLCASRPLTVKEVSIAMTKYDYDTAMQAQFHTFSKRERRIAEYCLKHQNNIVFYILIDSGDDLARLVGPLVHIEATPNEINGQSDPDLDRTHSPHVLLCHQTVKEHFISRPDFIDAGKTHPHMASLCARIDDGTVQGDPDVVLIRPSTGSSHLTPLRIFTSGKATDILRCNSMNIAKQKTSIPEEQRDIDTMIVNTAKVGG
jgi:hypothetical protein